MTKFLLALCGLPASGKTTLAEQIRNRLKPQSRVEIVSTDKWRDQDYYARFVPKKEHAVRQGALEVTAKTLSRGTSVIHDDTNYYSSMRHELYEIAKGNRCAFAVVHVCTPLEVVVKWNQSRANPLPEEVILKIARNFESPGSKYQWDRAIAVVDLSQIRAEDAALEVAKAIRALKTTHEKTIAAREREVDELDIATRQAVASFLKEFESYRNAARVHRIRRTILAECRKRKSTPEEARDRVAAELKRLLVA
jgi:O-phosphoseryl-tRNA(Sec) kinase